MNFEEIKQGFNYFVLGWHLIMQKGLRRFVIVPFIINIILLGAIFYLFLHQINQFNHWLMAFIPDWLGVISYLILALGIAVILLFFYFIFTILAGFIAAPFNGLLAEKVEIRLTGEETASMTLLDLTKDLPRIFKREWQKLCYSWWRLVLLFLCGFIPFLGQTIVPFLFFIFTAWLLAIQYCDYPFDNHKVDFQQMKLALAQKRWLNLTFGGLVSLCAFIPLVNFIVMPVAVCGATAIWVDHYRRQFKSNLAENRTD
ncbi:sulfate transporter CysZ [Mergibacter septicus]|uniref:sulfate transporter CysZ n=1 Tax=Mergibacter septicus TaxID=221402 RepID=UPI0011797069|nr:sulfate transporter CysZ [Mergibacter septicus]AWX14298.1 sulfate transporter CysZ [Mergibacter septicus]